MTVRTFIIPAELREAGDTLARAMGFAGPVGVFVQPLSPTGAEPPTHWGFPAVVGAEFVALWANPPPEAAALVSRIEITDEDGIDTGAHFQAVIAARGLAVVQVEEKDA